LSSLKVYKEELVLVRELHKAAVADALELKERIAQTNRMNRGPINAITGQFSHAAGIEVRTEENAPEYESKIEEDEDEDITANCISLRDTVKQEVDKYLRLVHSTQPGIVQTDLPPLETRPSYLMSETRARTTSERIALDLAESRRRLELLRDFAPGKVKIRGGVF
jgi:hypothetical protein